MHKPLLWSRERRQPGAPALAEADRREALSAGAGAQEHLVAVLKKASLFTGLEAHRPLSTLGGFEQAAAASLIGCRDCARAEEIARPEIAAVAGVVRNHLRNRPIHVPGAAQRQSVWAQAFLLEPRREQKDLKFEIQAALTLVSLVPQIGKRRWIALRPWWLRCAERGERLGRDDPR